MKSTIYHILILLLYSIGLSAQGKVMLVGGGGEDSFEDTPNWSNMPYQWAVDQSANKRVVVITFSESDATDFLPNYFKNLGAVAAKNMVIGTSEVAQSQITYDSLITYDVFFFKGGNQANYYETYKSSQVSAAITDKFNAGGVICGTSAGMAILSEVIFPAIDGTVYPDEVLQNSNRTDLIFKNDFVNILPNYIVDSHFIERGRFPRLISFMGNWKQTEGESIGGIGVDDQTAFCIDDQGIGTAYGNGAVSVFSLYDYTTSSDKPVVDSATVTHLLHGKQYDLINQELLSSYETTISPSESGEAGNYTLYLAGTATFSHNQNLLNELIAVASPTITIVSKQNSTVADDYADYLTTNGTSTVKVIQTIMNADSCHTVADRNWIRDSQTFVFVDNTESQLFNYLENHPTGRLLHQQLFKDDQILAFLGEDAKYAGHTYVTNNTTDDLNAFFGDLEFEAGIGLLANSTIVPDAFPNATDFYENNSAAIPYAMVQERLEFGIYVNERSYVKFYQQDGKNWIDGFGNSSAILLTNQSDNGAVSNEAVNSAGDMRNLVGFEQMKYSLLAGNPQAVGVPMSSGVTTSAHEIMAPSNLSSIQHIPGEIELTWNSVTEATGYVLERSINQGNFSEIASLSAAETSYVDSDITLQQQYTYRVKAINGMVNSCYSDETAPIVTALPANEFPTLKIKNPVTSGQLFIQGLEGKELAIDLRDLNGRLILREKDYQENEIMDVSSLRSGLYILQLRYQDNIESFKIFIQY
ncbi:MAG: Type 1 glutamine amidotransferase-like domain-containing protein [Flammeovirgaceae bacterium]